MESSIVQLNIGINDSHISCSEILHYYARHSTVFLPSSSHC